MTPYPKIAKGTVRTALQISAPPSQEGGRKFVWNIEPEISNLSLPANADIIFATCICIICESEAKAQVIWEVLQMFEAILQKYHIEEEVPTKVLLK
jgi:hypothetical protein